MTPLSDGEVAILSRLADVAQQQAVTTERLTAVLEKIDDHLSRMDSERDNAVSSVKAHVSAVLDKHDAWWRKFGIVWGIVMVLVSAIGGVVARFFPAQPK